MAAEPILNDKTLAEIVKLGRMSVTVQTAKEGGLPFVVIPTDCKVQDLGAMIFNEHNERPERKSGTVKVLDGPSFCEYYTLFHDENSRIFADETNDKVLAILDYHGAGDNAPRWGKHRIELTLRHSEEWTRWSGQDGKRVSQTEFAEFIEDNGPDVITPDAATMLEVARDLSAKIDADFGSAVRMQNGSVQFKYSEQVKGTYGSGQVEIPERFIISIPVHVGSDRVSITARLRYRINAGKLTFWYDLLRAEQIERDAFMAVHAGIAKRLGVTIINGTPA